MATVTALLSVLAALAGRALADPFWIVQHGKATVVSRLDPIVTPNGTSTHVHSVVGGSAFSSNYNYEASVAGNCTTANIFVDHSNYWVSQLYRKEDDGTLNLVHMNRGNTGAAAISQGVMNVDNFPTNVGLRCEGDHTRSGPDEKVHPFPPGFQMLAGDSKRTTYDDNDYSNKAISYVCLGVSGSPETHAFPEQSCPDDLRAQVFFPNCWDGVNNWLPKSAHVAYPESGGHDSGGPCPASHPNRIMSLFYEFHFTDRYEYKPGARTWSTGDTVGYSMHGDFTNGWPVGFFEEAFAEGDTCNVGFSIENCPPLNKVFTGNGGGECIPDDPSVIIDEEVGLNGSLTQLPGNPTFGGAGSSPSTSPISGSTTVIDTAQSSVLVDVGTAIPNAATSSTDPAGTTIPTVPTAEATLPSFSGINLVAESSTGEAPAAPAASATAGGADRQGHKACQAKRRLGAQL